MEDEGRFYVIMAALYFAVSLFGSRGYQTASCYFSKSNMRDVNILRYLFR